MTFMEKLADIISGGAVTKCLDHAKEMTQRAYIAEGKLYRVDPRAAALRAIIAATDNGKSGTARKINRMAREGLGQ